MSIPLVMVCGIVCLYLHYQKAFGAVLLIGSLGLGFSCSLVFPLLISLSTEYKIRFTPDQLSNIMFVPVFSTMIVAGGTGILMHHLSVVVLLYSLLLIGTLLLLDAILIFFQIDKEVDSGRIINEEN